MPIIIGGTTPSSPTARATLTVADVLGSTARDVQRTLAPDSPTLIDYCDRIHLELCRLRPWPWLLSAPKYFITETDQPYYWLGATATNPAGTVDTALNLTDLDHLDPTQVEDVTLYQPLSFTRDTTLVPGFELSDGRIDTASPLQFSVTDDNPFLLTISPAPSNDNVLYPLPPAPHSTIGSGGALAARTYYLKITYVDSAGGESTASNEARQYVTASHLLTVRTPEPPLLTSQSGITYTKYNVYASTATGGETLQNITPTSIGTDWTEPTSGLTTSGAVVPTTSTLEPLRGHVIKFRYLQQINRLTATSDSLQLPDTYRDVLIAGINWLAFLYRDVSGGMGSNLPSNLQASSWQSVYERGKAMMKGNEFKRTNPVMWVGTDTTRNMYA